MAAIRALLNAADTEPRDVSPPPPSPPRFMLPPIAHLAPLYAPALAAPAPPPPPPPPLQQQPQRQFFPLSPPPSPSSADSSPPSPPSPPSRQHDLQRNRDTSSRHRQNKRLEAERVAMELEGLREEREVLKVDTAAQIASGARKGEVITTGFHAGLLVRDMSYRQENDVDWFEPLSAETTRVMGGIDRVSEPVAHVLLEVIAIRRGMVPPICPKGLTWEESYRFTCLEYDKLLGNLAHDEYGDLVPHYLWRARLNEFTVLYVRWDAWEASHCWWKRAGYALDEDPEDDAGTGAGGGRPSGGAARQPRRAGRLGAGRDPLHGIKRCRRCQVLKTAGSGHRRSHCADGYLVSSEVPYMSAAAPKYRLF